MATNQLLGICLFFLQLEERMLWEGRPKMAQWSRRQYMRYRARLEAIR